MKDTALQSCKYKDLAQCYVICLFVNFSILYFPLKNSFNVPHEQCSDLMVYFMPICYICTFLTSKAPHERLLVKIGILFFNINPTKSEIVINAIINTDWPRASVTVNFVSRESQCFLLLRVGKQNSMLPKGPVIKCKANFEKRAEIPATTSGHH